MTSDNRSELEALARADYVMHMDSSIEQCPGLGYTPWAKQTEVVKRVWRRKAKNKLARRLQPARVPEGEAVAYLRIDPAGIEQPISVMPEDREKWAALGYQMRPLGVIANPAPESREADHSPGAGNIVDEAGQREGEA